MQFEGSKVVGLSPSDAVTFLHCPHALWLAIAREGGEDIASAPPGLFVEMIAQKGIEHERKIWDRLRRECGGGIEIGDGDAEAQTVAAMRRGEPLIYQGYLKRERRRGRPDFLIRTPAPSDLGGYSYEPGDAKLSAAAKPSYVLQLCAYADMLEEIQGVLPLRMRLYCGSRDGCFLTANYLEFYRRVARRMEDFAVAPPPQSAGKPCAHCAFCEFRSYCESEWERDNRLFLIAGITGAQVVKMESDGIKTVAGLAARRAKKIPRMAPMSFDRLQAQARMQEHKRKTGKDGCKARKWPQDGPRRGFACLPPPAAGDIFFDIEGYPFYEDGNGRRGLEYLFGAVFCDGGKWRFHKWLADDRGEEKKAFVNCMEFVVRRLIDYPRAHLYHYAAYEKSAFQRLAGLHAICEQEVDWLMREDKLTDLHRVVREGLTLSTPNYKLKSIERFFAHTPRTGLSDGGDSVVYFDNWRKTGDAKLLRQICEYNEQDCRSLVDLRDWLEKNRAHKKLPAFAVQEDSGGEAPTETARDKEESKLRDFIAAAVRSQRDKRQAELLQQVASFHRRDERPQWWAYFHRCRDADEDELIEDAGALGGLSFIDRNKGVLRYQFPEQESKRRAHSEFVVAGEKTFGAGCDPLTCISASPN